MIYEYSNTNKRTALFLAGSRGFDIAGDVSEGGEPHKIRCFIQHKMKLQVLLLVIVAALLLQDASAQRRSGRRRNRKQHHSTPVSVTESTQEVEDSSSIDDLANSEKLAEEKYQDAERLRLQEMEKQKLEGYTGEITNNNVFEDPCSKVHCSAGRVCELNEEGEAECNCIKECPYESDFRRKVCTNHNETWDSDCSVYQQRCLCLSGSEKCMGPQFHHVQIEYYGQCREMPECLESEMSDFPRRMRDWLFNIMRDLADRQELSQHYLKMEREAESNLTRRWANAAVWKWCDLDAHDNDRFVSRHELFPIRAPLMSLEHCIAPFLDGCDANDDHRLTLTEWGKCLELEEEDFEERCDEFTEQNS